EIEVDGKSYKADNFILATGSVPIALPFLPFDEKRVLSSTGALALNDVPKTMVVIGAGAIGVELASVYSRLGTKITIIEMLPVVTPAMDPALSKQLLQSLKKQGIDFLLEAKVASAKVNDKSVTLKVEHENNTLTIEAEVVLVCIGRKAFTEGLNLEAAAVATNPKGMIAVDANFRTSQSHIYAIGDVIDGPMLAHKASHEGIAVSEIIAGKTPHLNYMAIPNVVYTHPEVASVGMTESEAKAAGLDLLIGTSYFRGNGRARCSGDFEGFVKVIGDVKSGRLLGMHIIGAHASELIAEGMVAIEKKATLVDLASACHAHPTLSETIMEASQQALGYAIHG
ncbi:MAG TPA: FAD-dependent oxidoreductase, partial [Parachlamydiaceae bacterium]|nr:FAD-dependent oxidoreductase [Parachlamydiaceae bacterium]